MPREKRYYVYIMSSKGRVLYVGVTGFLMARVLQHKAGEVDSFTQRYHVNRLAYYEVFQYDSIKYLYELLAHPMDQLEVYLHEKKSDIQGPKTAYIFAYFIRRQVDELRVIAREIDEEFDS